MPDRIVTATSTDGAVSVVAGITTALVGEAQRRHELAPTASAALGRLVTGAALLGATLKGRERLSLQIAADGPLRRLVADVSLLAPDAIGARTYTGGPQVDIALNARGKFDVAAAVGRGHLQVTRSFEIGQPYVGIVPLVTSEIGEDIAAYLAASEQIPSVVALGVLADQRGIRAAGGAIAQVMPGADEATIARLETAAATMSPVTTQIDAGASPSDIAQAIAGTVALRMHGAFTLEFACRCTREKVAIAMLGLGRDELLKIADEEPRTEAVCEFCRQPYHLTSEEVRGLVDRLNVQ